MKEQHKKLEVELEDLDHFIVYLEGRREKLKNESKECEIRLDEVNKEFETQEKARIQVINELERYEKARMEVLKRDGGRLKFTEECILDYD